MMLNVPFFEYHLLFDVVPFFVLYFTEPVSMNILRSRCFGMKRFVPALFSIIVLVGTLSGCGAKAYEERLETTSAYYDYIDRLNQNLGPQFFETGVSMRVPKQFVLVPAPPKRPRKPVKPNPAAGGTVAEQATEPEEIKDPRQPDFIDVELPGLIGAWKADLETVGGAGGSTQSAAHPGHIYLLSNYEYWRTFKTERATINPVEFHDEVMKRLTGAFNIVIEKRARGTATDRINKWFTETVPQKKDERFAPKKEITTITLVPSAEQEQEGFQREYQVYLFANGDIKIALIYALPRNVSTGEDLLDRILFSLQTLNVSAEKPGGASNKTAAPAGAPAKSGPGF